MPASGSRSAFPWRTASFALLAGLVSFAVISAAVAIAQGSRVFAPACSSTTFHYERAIPWAFVAFVPIIVYVLVRTLAERHKPAPVASGEGPYRQSLFEDARIHAPRSHHFVRLAFALLALGIGYSQSRSWCELKLPTSCRPQMKRILMVPLGPIDSTKVDRLARHFKDCYGLPVVVAAPIEAPASAFNIKRKQWSAQRLLRALPLCPQGDSSCESQFTISITDLDIYIEDVDWNWALGWRDPERSVAVISTFRMTSYFFFDEEERLTKLTAKDIAITYCGLPLTLDPHNIRYSVGGVLQLDAMDESNW